MWPSWATRGPFSLPFKLNCTIRFTPSDSNLIQMSMWMSPGLAQVWPYTSSVSSGWCFRFKPTAAVIKRFGCYWSDLNSTICSLQNETWSCVDVWRCEMYRIIYDSFIPPSGNLEWQEFSINIWIPARMIWTGPVCVKETSRPCLYVWRLAGAHALVTVCSSSALVMSPNINHPHSIQSAFHTGGLMINSERQYDCLLQSLDTHTHTRLLLSLWDIFPTDFSEMILWIHTQPNNRVHSQMQCLVHLIQTLVCFLLCEVLQAGENTPITMWPRQSLKQPAQKHEHWAVSK